jgi:hypothetical protein
MLWPPVLRALLGSKFAANEGDRGHPLKDDDLAVPAGSLFEDKTVAVSCHSRFADCHFKRCEFLWAGKASGWQKKVFLDCTFEDCEFGMPVVEFLSYTTGGAINTDRGQGLSRQQAIDEAVRRLHHQRPFLVELSLRPSHDKAREQVIDWIRAEYQKIMAEDAVIVSERAAEPAEGDPMLSAAA